MDGFLDDSNGEQQDGYAAGVGAGGGAGAGAGARMASFPAPAGTASSPPSTRALPASLAMLHGAAVSTSRRSVFDDVDDYDNVGDATFEEDDTAVYRSVKAAPAMPQVQVVATGSELGTTQGLTRYDHPTHTQPHTTTHIHILQKGWLLVHCIALQCNAIKQP